jgi:hypothetical protein
MFSQAKKWDTRLLCITQEAICFGNMGTDVQIDHIPLAEVFLVQFDESDKVSCFSRAVDALRRIVGFEPGNRSPTFTARKDSNDLEQISAKFKSFRAVGPIDDEHAFRSNLCEIATVKVLVLFARQMLLRTPA